MKIPEGFRKQSSNLNMDNGLIVIMLCRNPSQGMRSGTWRDFGSAFSSDQCMISWYANLVRWGKKEDPTCPLCQGRQTTEHVLSSCRIALSQGRYTWKHKRVLQELAAIISTSKRETLSQMPCLEQTSAIMILHLSLSSVIRSKAMLSLLFPVTKELKLSRNVILCLPLLLVPSILPVRDKNSSPYGDICVLKLSVAFSLLC